VDDNLSIVVCARDEIASIRQVVGSLRATFPSAELIVVDNGSSDGTGQAAAAIEGVIVVREETPGKGGAMRTGARHATRPWLLFHDADQEYEVVDSVQVVKTAMKSDSCCVGVRLVAYDRILISSWLANRFIQLLLKLRTGAHVRDVLSGTRCMRSSMFAAANTESTRFGIETELTRRLLGLGVELTWEPVRFYPRSAAMGKKIRMWHLLELSVQALKAGPVQAGVPARAKKNHNL
jgi:glycosyltransferase involved in cell wall biosynthesis